MRLVVALGGNALDAGGDDRMQDAARELAELGADGIELVVTHGNGPQVGELLLDQEARRERPRAPDALPLHTLVAMTQAQLGDRIQRAVAASLPGRGHPDGVAVVVTHVRVDPEDPAFSHPSKPIGPRYDDRPDDSHAYGRRDDGAWRRVVPSPEPLEVVEVAALRALVAAAVMPIAAGGGGIPVVRRGGRSEGVDAVVDKDLTSALLVPALDADGLLVLTDVAAVERDHGSPAATPVGELTVAEAREMVTTGGADTGSMAPKLEAAARVADAGRLAVIGRLGAAREALDGTTGTRVVGGGTT